MMLLAFEKLQLRGLPTPSKFHCAYYDMRFGRGRDEPEHPDPVFDEDQDLSEVWPQVVQQYEDTTKRKLDMKTTFKSFQLQIDADIKESTTKSHQHARTVLNNIGACLEKFGSIVAQGASIVFGPSAQCWNAISFVIQAVRGFSDMMDGFVTLMERSSAFLRRLVHFMEQEVGKDGSQLPRLLRKPAYEILSQFLGVLRSSYKLATSTRERVKSMAGIVLFNSNDKVAESLKLMESRIEDFTRAEVDDILLGVKGLARYLDKSDEERARHQSEIQEYLQATYKVTDQVLSVTQQMKTTLDGRASKEQQKENLVKIVNSLGLKKAGDWETWGKRHSELCKVHVQGTGEWLSQDEPAFIKWTNLDQHDGNVLFLKAESGFGKTHLFNYVVSYLETKCRAARGPNQAYLAYYYYGDDKDDSLERCIGSIIYQFAAADVGYAQAVADECGRLTNIARAEDRWSSLVSGLQHAMKGTYFICMDGFNGRGQLDAAEAMMSTIARQATSTVESNGVSLRLFISGNDEALSEVSQGVEGIHTIVLGQPRDSARSTERACDDPDIASVSESLPNASDLRAVTRARIKDVCKTKPDLKAILNEENIELLLEGIHGNYKNLEAKITEINACDTKGKVQEVINNTSADMDTVQRNRVKTLDALLTSRQAQVLNELLVWVAGLSYQPSTKLLESVLFFTFGEEFLLADQIATTYSPVLVIDKEGKAMAQKVHIHLDDENIVNVKIISMCVDALFDSRKDVNLQGLRDYAMRWFYSHLKALVEALDDFEPSRKFLTEMGVKLVDLLYDPKMIDTWFAEKNLAWLNVEQILKPEKPFEEWSPPSLEELDEFFSWVKNHMDVTIDDFTWDFRVGATNGVFEHYKEAIIALEKAEQQLQTKTNWSLLYNLAQAHEEEKNYRTALKYIHDFKSLSNQYLETDDSYKTAYWSLLLSEGRCHQQCDEYDLAVKSFQDLLGQHIDEESGSEWLQLSALSGLFTTWTKTRSFESIMVFVRSWKDVTDKRRGSTYWLRKAAYEDIFHTSMIVAAKHAGAVGEILSLYQKAIDYKPMKPFEKENVDAFAEATEMLMYFQAVLRFHGSSSRNDQHRSIQYWEEIVQKSDENPRFYVTAWNATRKLAPTLLDKAVAELATTSSSAPENYISRLEKLANLNTTVVCNLRQGYLDPRLCLARYYCLKGDDAAAAIQAQARLCSVFDKWPEATDDSSLRLRFSNLAQTLNVLDKDVDAIAAWQAIQPYQQQLQHALEADAKVPGAGEPTQPIPEAPHTNGVPASSDKKPDDVSDASPSATTTTTTKAYISDYTCDGACGVGWRDMLTDCWVCKHCLCVQFCPACHEKLLADDLHPLVCNKSHKMLYLPPFDWDAWRAAPADMMAVGGQLISRKEWVAKLCKEFNVQQHQIDLFKMEKARELKAGSVLAVRWRNRLQRIRGRKKLEGVPTLKRAKTVG
ncbi:Tetratricopeptide-like helical [Pyrenophora seminiperda CCB06]|uniref:Tetratricopeptide-like helical n=1 Tax=Pyrenophora seminiperda CCB06 TaxID=1302712 RepID=A0A3M7MD83_9PLEO|nr:Tetratricopeptide-like helical [Pyrenophora seminiperda CCB06]